MDEGGRFGIKTVQALRLLVHKCVVLWHELPPDFRWNDVVVGLWRSHDEDCAVSKNTINQTEKKERKYRDQLTRRWTSLRGTGGGVDDQYDLEGWSEW